MPRDPRIATPVTPENLSIIKKVVFSIVTVCCFFLLAEGTARLIMPVSDASLFQTQREMITILGLSRLNEAMQSDPVTFWSLRKNLQGLRIAGSIKGHPIDFSVSTNDLGLRSPAVDNEKHCFRILALGNSCTFGVGVNDRGTWPAQLEQILGEMQGVDAEVINAGVPGYTAMQGMWFLKNRGLDLDPDLVIACFGFNDVDAWGSRSDAEIAARLSANRRQKFASKSRLYLSLRMLKERRRALSAGPEGARRSRLSPEEFLETLLAMNRMCAERKVPFMLLIWPFQKQKLGEAPELVAYQPIIVRAGVEGRIPVVSLVRPFLEAEETLFVDHIHADSVGCRIAAGTIAETMARARVR